MKKTWENMEKQRKSWLPTSTRTLKQGYLKVPYNYKSTFRSNFYNADACCARETLKQPLFKYYFKQTAYSSGALMIFAVNQQMLCVLTRLSVIYSASLLSWLVSANKQTACILVRCARHSRVHISYVCGRGVIFTHCRSCQWAG